MVKFVPFDKFDREYSDLSPEALSAESYEEEQAAIKASEERAARHRQLFRFRDMDYAEPQVSPGVADSTEVQESAQEGY